MSKEISATRPVDIVEVDGRWHAVFADGTIGPALSLDEVLEACALLAPEEN